MEPGAGAGQILIANPGSTSRKYTLYDGGEKRFSLVFRQQEDGVQYTVDVNGQPRSGMLAGANLKNAFGTFLHGADTVPDFPIRPQTIALRIVASGSTFQRHSLMDDGYIRNLQKQAKLIPLHVSSTLEDHRELQTVFPNAQFLGISDSAFHITQLPVTKQYGLDPVLAGEYDLHRFGYHGLAAESAVGILSAHYPVHTRKLVLCHLGGGTSIIAIRNAKSIYASMGFSPLEGPMMVTRSGDLDPALVAFLGSEIFSSREELIAYLSRECGMKGLMHTADMREVVRRYEANDPLAVAAVDKYTHDILKYIGIAFMALQGVDALVFSGGIGEHANLVREKILRGLEFLGYRHGDQARELDSRCHRLDDDGSKICAYVVKVDEEAVMLRSALTFLKASGNTIGTAG